MGDMRVSIVSRRGGYISDVSSSESLGAAALIGSPICSAIVFSVFRYPNQVGETSDLRIPTVAAPVTTLLSLGSGRAFLLRVCIFPP